MKLKTEKTTTKKRKKSSSLKRSVKLIYFQQDRQRKKIQITISSNESDYILLKDNKRDFPGGTVVKNPPANVRDTGSIPGPGRSHMPRSN